SYEVEKVSLISRMLSGQRDDVIFIPVDDMRSTQGGLEISHEGVISYQDMAELKMDGELPEIIERRFWFGTDKYGRDVLSRLVLGLRASLFVGFLAVIVSLSIGVFLGSMAGYFGGYADRLIMLLINTSWSIPTLLMAFAIILALGRGFGVVILAIGLTMWVDVARIVRGQVLQTKSELYVQAAKISGYHHIRIIARHILPNVSGPILVMAAANFATAILVEAGLSFLGLGIQPPTPSLGNMLQESYAYATGGFVYLAVFPILTIMSLVLCFNLLGTALRDVFDVRSG
ncbi:MAG: ABC transporter permease, partial [Bacteroidota bacterium]